MEAPTLEYRAVIMHVTSVDASCVPTSTGNASLRSFGAASLTRDANTMQKMSFKRPLTTPDIIHKTVRVNADEAAAE